MVGLDPDASQGGALVDDIDYCSRVHEMFRVLTSNSRIHGNVEGFVSRWDDDDTYNIGSTESFPDLAGGSSSSTCFKPLCGLLRRHKLSPLGWCPITLEFEAISSATGAAVTLIKPMARSPPETHRASGKHKSFDSLRMS